MESNIVFAFYILAILALFLMASVFLISMYLDFQGLAICSYYGIPLYHWHSMPKKKARAMRKKYFAYIAEQRKKMK